MKEKIKPQITGEINLPNFRYEITTDEWQRLSFTVFHGDEPVFGRTLSNLGGHLAFPPDFETPKEYSTYKPVFEHAFRTHLNQIMEAAVERVAEARETLDDSNWSLSTLGDDQSLDEFIKDLHALGGIPARRLADTPEDSPAGPINGFVIDLIDSEIALVNASDPRLTDIVRARYLSTGLDMKLYLIGCNPNDPMEFGVGTTRDEPCLSQLIPGYYDTRYDAISAIDQAWVSRDAFIYAYVAGIESNRPAETDTHTAG